MPNHEEGCCRLCRKPKPTDELLNGHLVHDPLAGFIQKKYPDWTEDDPVCLSCLNENRVKYVQSLLEADKGELSLLEKEVLQNIERQQVLARNINKEFDEHLTLGEKVADKVAEFGGSWGFIISFGSVLLIWIVVNSIAVLMRPFDPFPYILLNLVLSCLAAIQAPIIMMSQNRQAKKDRMLADHDYRVNLKAELEIQQISWKIDQLLTHNWQRLLEIQRVQTEMMEELTSKKS